MAGVVTPTLFICTQQFHTCTGDIMIRQHNVRHIDRKFDDDIPNGLYNLELRLNIILTSQNFSLKVSVCQILNSV